MSKFKLGVLPDDRPVRLSVEVPAATHRLLLAYAAVLAQETGQKVLEPAKLVVPMIEQFMASDREFVKTQRETMAAQAGR